MQRVLVLPSFSIRAPKLLKYHLSTVRRILIKTWSCQSFKLQTGTSPSQFKPPETVTPVPRIIAALLHSGFKATFAEFLHGFRLRLDKGGHKTLLAAFNKPRRQHNCEPAGPLIEPGLVVPRGPSAGIKCRKGVQRTVCLHGYYKTWLEIAHPGISKFRVVGLFTCVLRRAPCSR